MFHKHRSTILYSTTETSTGTYQSRENYFIGDVASMFGAKIQSFQSENEVDKYLFHTKDMNLSIKHFRFI